jgi:hypothetical protein
VGHLPRRGRLVVTQMSEKIGSVTRDRYDAIVVEIRTLLQQRNRIQFVVGDRALEIEPLQTQGGARPARSEVAYSFDETLQMFADDTGATIHQVRRWRWISSRWPKEQRRDDVPHYVHGILAAISDPEARFAKIAEPPLIKRTGEHRWNQDGACRVVGWQVGRPESVQEKVDAVHELVTDAKVAWRIAADLLRRPEVAFTATTDTTVQDRVAAAQELVRDEEVASRIATDLLRRPQVAARAMTDTTARHQVNRAQVDHARQGAEIVRQRTPALRHIEHTTEFLDLVGACAQFVASAGRIVPGLRGQNYTDDEKATVQRNLARVRAAADWIDGAVATGQVTPEEGLARLMASE